jgi:hypothetical protein
MHPVAAAAAEFFREQVGLVVIGLVAFHMAVQVAPQMEVAALVTVLDLLVVVAVAVVGAHLAEPLGAGLMLAAAAAKRLH